MGRTAPRRGPHPAGGSSSHGERRALQSAPRREAHHTDEAHREHQPPRKTSTPPRKGRRDRAPPVGSPAEEAPPHDARAALIGSPARRRGRERR